MSEPSQEARGVRARFSRWNARRRGRSTLKAAYTQAARDVKRMDPAVRERIGRANLTKADLQQLAGFHVDAQFRPGRYGDMSQRLGQAAGARLQRSGPAPRQPRISRTRNPARALANRYSRWGRNQRQGTKTLKAALKQAARDVKRTDPAVQLAIGRSTLNSADLAALASGRMDQVFRPEGRFQGLPGQQGRGQGQSQGQGQGRGQAQGPGIQSRDAVRQVPAPQQSEQLNQQIIALQQSIEESRQQVMTLMEQITQLQAQMRQVLEAQVQQLQQQLNDQGAQPQPELGQQPEIDGRQSPEGQQPENTDDHVRLDNAVIPAVDGPAGEQPSQTGEQLAVPGDQEAGGELQGQGDDERVAAAETLDTSEGFTRIAEGDQGLAGAEVDENGALVLPAPEPTEPRAENEGAQTGAEAETKQPAQGEQAPTTGAEQPGTNPQQPQPQQAQESQGPVDPKKVAEKEEIARAAAASGDVAPLTRSTPEAAALTAQSGQDDSSKPRPGVAPRGPAGREGR